MNAISPKIEPRHLGLRALVYVRQSTPRQVLANQESTRRPYQLAERAQQMGSPAPRIDVIDEDLGRSGAGRHMRTGFQRLVAAIGLGGVGLVLVTEVSRLSRLNSDWHRVIELCGVLQQRGLVTKAPKRSAHRKKRARRPLPGMLLFQDGSKHAWLPQGPELDLIVTLDDATSAILSAVLVEEEGTASSFVGLKQTIAAHGLFSALYTDRGSHSFHTPTAGEPVDKTCLTQVGRALKQLGIAHIPSCCPEGRGRRERLFGTLQSRLPPLLRQEGLASIEAANRWLTTVYIPHHNTPFAGAPPEGGTALVPFVCAPGAIPCVPEGRA